MRPLPVGPVPRALGLAVLALTLLAALTRPAHAFTLASVQASRDADARLWVAVRVDTPIEPRVARSLGRGMPATLTLHAELWRRRSGWFDRLEQASEVTFRMRYDVWGDRWRLEDPDGHTLVVRTLDSLQSALGRTIDLPMARLDRLAPDAPCYVVVTASLRPLNVEDAEEVEGWLSGEVRDQGGSGLGVLTGLPRSLFEAARNFAGFGDQRVRRIGATFTPSQLPVVPR